jgi:hypothetical protein
MIERSLATVVTVLAVSVIGCGSKDQVIMTAKVSQPTLTVEATALTTELSGSFEIVLTLGDRVADPTSVDIGIFSLQRDDIELLSPLDLETDPAFPVDLDIGQTRRVDVTIRSPEAEVELAAELCAGDVEIVGTLIDAAFDDRPISVSSGPFAPECL